ncbi:MAG: glycosyltransferase family 2 protein, partial [Verrucomicrobia bacterium]|nr:glycosyltransferase family 2 protein [Verrucomicrobiota bacterium]
AGISPTLDAEPGKHTMNESATLPRVWAVTLGFNNAADTIECLQSVARSEGVDLRILLVDNASRDDTVERVLKEFPAAGVIRLKENTGFARGFNVGLLHALREGADFVFMINNDTTIAPDLLRRLAEAAAGEPRAAILVPKIFYYDEPKTIWSAGSRFRAFPPAIIIRRGRGPDDGLLDQPLDLPFATTCALAFPRWALEKLGLLDRNFFFFSEDYDLSLRARAAEFLVRFVPEAHMWHKISKSTKVGSPNPFFWRTYGRSTRIFCRKHRATHPWMTGPLHLLYVLLRMAAEGKRYGIRPFMEGWREGGRTELLPVPQATGEGVDPGELVRPASPTS